MLKANKGNNVVCFGNLGLKTEDAKVFLQNNPPAVKFRLLVDIYYVAIKVGCLWH